VREASRWKLAIVVGVDVVGVDVVGVDVVGVETICSI
jgi:hypothetical protein